MHPQTGDGAMFSLDNGQRGQSIVHHTMLAPLTSLSGQTWRRAQSCQPVTFKKSIIELKKPYFEVKKSIFARRARITSTKRASRARSAKFFRPGSRAPGSTRVLGALWCNLSLIFEHYYSKTLTMFS